MNVAVDGANGELSVLPPLSKAEDSIQFRAKMDLVIGLTACSAPQSNNGSFKPMHFHIDGPGNDAEGSQSALAIGHLRTE
jgi:uncharacterized protein YcgI (DUF1989 family)